ESVAKPCHSNYRNDATGIKNRARFSEATFRCTCTPGGEVESNIRIAGEHRIMMKMEGQWHRDSPGGSGKRSGRPPATRHGCGNPANGCRKRDGDRWETEDRYAGATFVKEQRQAD